jgi:Tfp pilus assembly protein PilO
MKKVKLLPREKLIVTVAVLAVVGYVFYTYWYTPYNNKINQANGEVTGLKTEISQKKALIAKQIELIARQKDIQEKAKVLSEQLPSVEAVPSVMDDLKGLFGANGASVTSMTLQSNGKGQGQAQAQAQDTKSIQVVFTGSYAQALAVVNAIENDTKRTYTVGDLSLTQGGGTLLTQGGGALTVYIHLGTAILPGYEYKSVGSN